MMGPFRVLLTEQGRVPLQFEPILAVVLYMGTDAELVAVAAAAFRAVVVAVGDVRRSSALLNGHWYNNRKTLYMQVMGSIL